MGKTGQSPDEYIEPLNMNGLQGRVLHMPAPKGRDKEILFVYGHHSSLERWFGLMQNLNRYAAVTMPDLPGFGGMDSFYKLGETATIDNLADYLASFIKMRYKRRKVIIVGMSFGFVVATRMLQRSLSSRRKLICSSVWPDLPTGTTLFSVKRAILCTTRWPASSRSDCRASFSAMSA